jgi:hypothetical protein
VIALALELAGALVVGAALGAAVTFRTFRVGVLLRVADLELARRQQLQAFDELPRRSRRRALHAARRARGRTPQ